MNIQFFGRCTSVLALSMIFSTSASFAEQQSTSTVEAVEHITVLGRKNNNLGQVTEIITNSVAPDVRDDMNRFAGVSTNENGPISAIIQQRGLFGDRIHVSHQGANIYGAGPNAMDSPLSHVISTAQPVVTVYRGIAPVSSGYETLGGTVKFEEQDWNFSQQLIHTGSAILGFTDNGEQHHVGLFHETQATDWGLRIAAQHQAGDDYEDGRGLRVFNTEYERRMANVSGVIKQGDSQYSLTIGHNNTDTAGTPALAMDIEYIDATWYRLGYKSPLADGIISAMIFGNHNRHDMSNFVLRERMPAMQRRNNVSSDVFGISLDWQKQWLDDSTRHALSIGAKALDREQTSLINNPANEMFFINNFNDIERDIATLFAELTTTYDSGLSTTFGIRPTRVSLNAGEVGSNMAMMNPNVASLVEQFNNSERQQDHQWIDAYGKLSKRFTGETQMSFTLAHKGRAPSYHELYTWFPLGISAGLADGRNYIGDVQLATEKAIQAELAVDFSTNQLRISPRVFWYDIDDYITGRPSTSMPANMIAMMMGASEPLVWSNTEARLYGFDIAAGYQINNAWLLGLSYEFVKGTDRELSEPLYRIAPQRLDVRLDYQRHQYSGFVEWVIVSEQNDSSVIQNESDTAGYGVLNAGGSIALTDTVQLSLAVKNVLDKAYVTHLGGINRVADANVNVGERLFEPGRSVSLSLKVSW